MINGGVPMMAEVEWRREQDGSGMVAYVDTGLGDGRVELGSWQDIDGVVWSAMLRWGSSWTELERGYAGEVSEGQRAAESALERFLEAE